jgi:16S rRNA (adenine1518-N6/adenine1519-N6)-dimethyltransferase
LEKGEFVLSVEKDQSFLKILQALKKQFKNFRYEIADVLEFDFQKVLKDYEYHVVANIPYYITGKIIQLFLQAGHKPKTLTLLVQKEVAENVIAKPGQLNLLAISVQLYGEAKILMKVPARDFHPSPKVDSAVLQIKILEKPKYEVGDQKMFFKILKACFTGKRKQIHNTLHNNLHLEKSFIENILCELKISTTARPQELTIEQWLGLVKKITEK